MNNRKKILQTVAAGALIALFTGGAQAAVLPFANPGFDSDDASGGDVAGATGWNAFGGGAFTCDGNLGVNAGASCPVPDSNNNTLKVFSTSGVNQSFAATAGDVFTMTGLGLNSSLDPILNVSELLLQIAFFDANGAPAGTEAAGQVALGFNLFNSNVINANTPQDVWTAMVVGTAPAPDNTAEVRYIVLGLLGSGGAGFFDSIGICDLEYTNCPSLIPDIPIPAAVWLFGSGLLGLIGIARRKAA